MTLNIELRLEDKHANLTLGYHRIHILRDYAAHMVGGQDEEYPEAKKQFPNLVWHSDSEGYYVGFLPTEFSPPEPWSEDSQIWVGSVQGLYKELQRISTHMIETRFEGEAKEILSDLLQLFTEVEYNPEENERYAIIIFS